MKKLFEIGKAAGVHGIKGDIKIFPYTNNPENLISQKYFLVNETRYEIITARIQDRFIVVHFKGIDSRESAEAMKNTVFSLPREPAAQLGEGQYYMEDMIGCRVYQNDKCLGVLDDIIETGSNDVYSVIGESGEEILIPALKNVILNIQIELKRIDVKLPEGLVDDEYF